MSESYVAKFGGTSMAQPELPAGIVEKRPEQQEIVVSAPGVDELTSEKMTDTLIRYADTVIHDSPAQTTLKSEIIDRFDYMYALLGDDDRREMRQALALQLTPSSRDDKEYFVSRGEAFSAAYFAKLIGATCTSPALHFLGNGQLDRIGTADAIRKQIAGIDGRVVIPGFFGTDKFGRIWLLQRGGSDRSGAIYAAALGLDYENWTDVEGVYTAPPKKVPAAQPVAELTRHEVREGAHGGSGVLQGDTILDLDGSDTVTYVRSTLNPEGAYTKIVADASQFETRVLSLDHPVVAVSGRDDLVALHIDDMGMADSVGYSERIYKEMARLGLPYEHSPTAQDYLSLVFRQSRETMEGIETLADFAHDNLMSPSGTISIEETGAVYLVGEALRDRRTNQLTLTRSLGHASVHGFNIEPMKNKLSPSLAFLTDRAAVDPLMRIFHAYEIEGRSMFKPVKAF